MSINFEVRSIDDAPEASRPILEQAQAAYGMVPNLFGVLAESPAALEGYTTLSRIFAGSSLSPTEQHVVLQTHNVANGCDYCAAAHSTIARGSGVNADLDDALRESRPLSDERLEALRQFTEALIRERGWVGDDAVDRFLAAGYTRGNVFDVILGISLKRLSNYSNHIARTPLDPAFQAQAWRQAG